MTLEIGEYLTNALLDVFKMDLSYFEAAVPVSSEIVNVMTAAGWALLIGNLLFQATKSMASALGFEGEDPKTLFMRTFAFSFLLLASRQICEIGLGISGAMIALLQIPAAITINVPDESSFAIGASWLLVLIVGAVVLLQTVKFFLEVGERYVIVAVLVILSPLAFAMGGSKNTEDITKGWARMFSSMCLIMALNVAFLKMLLSAMTYMPTGAAIFPWMALIIAIIKAARKIDDLVGRIGLNPAVTGGGMGRMLPGMLTYMAVKSAGAGLAAAAAKSAMPKPTGGGFGFGAGAKAPGGRQNAGRAANMANSRQRAQAEPRGNAANMGFNAHPAERGGQGPMPPIRQSALNAHMPGRGDAMQTEATETAGTWREAGQPPTRPGHRSAAEDTRSPATATQSNAPSTLSAGIGRAGAQDATGMNAAKTTRFSSAPQGVSTQTPHGGKGTVPLNPGTRDLPPHSDSRQGRPETRRGQFRPQRQAGAANPHENAGPQEGQRPAAPSTGTSAGSIFHAKPTGSAPVSRGKDTAKAANSPVGMALSGNTEAPKTPGETRPSYTKGIATVNGDRAPRASGRNTQAHRAPRAQPQMGSMGTAGNETAGGGAKKPASGTALPGPTPQIMHVRRTPSKPGRPGTQNVTRAVPGQRAAGSPPPTQSAHAASGRNKGKGGKNTDE